MLLEAENILTDREFERISELVYRHCGINLHDGKKDLVRARITKRLRACGIRSVREYIDHVMKDSTGEEFSEMIDAISTNLTSFFRENAHFQHLSREFLPNLLARKRKQGVNRILAWSAGCSSGEEPYSLAMTLLESIDSPENWEIRILATDICHEVLRTAERGRYAKLRVDSVPPGLRAKYFTTRREDGKLVYEVNEGVRSLVYFRHLNLMTPWPFKGPFDLIFCRNVMIYFDKPTQAKLVNRYHDHSQPGGLLFTGHSESLTGIAHKFAYVQPTIYARP